MKKLFYLIVFCLVSTSLLFSQSGEEKKSIFHVSFVPPMSTHGSFDRDYSNVTSLNILVGRSMNERAFTFGGLANLIDNDASGVQMAGLANTIGNNANGFQFAGLANTIGNKANGIQFAGLANIIGNGATGFQLAGLANVISDGVNGIQFGGLANVVSDGAKGFQLAGLGNIIEGGASGIQIAGLGNIVDGETRGLQMAGIMNVAETVKGVQIAGLVNKAQHVTGVQFAIVNMAEKSDYPIGLVNIIKEGEMSVGVSYNELGSTMVSFRSGGRVLYGILGLGYNYRSISKESFVIEGGIGAHINIASIFRLNTEAKAASLSSFSKKNTTHYSFSVLPAYKFTSNFELFAGPSINYLYSDNPDNADLFPNHNIWKKYKENSFKQLYLGFEVGVQYIF